MFTKCLILSLIAAAVLSLASSTTTHALSLTTDGTTIIDPMPPHVPQPTCHCGCCCCYQCHCRHPRPTIHCQGD